MIGEEMVMDMAKKTSVPNALGRVTRDVRNVGRLTLGLARDTRVPKRNKLIFTGIAAYILMPLDLVPDWLPGIGRLDDLIMAGVALDAVLNHVPQDVLDTYWEGDQATLDLVRSLVASAADFIPAQLQRTLYPTEFH